MRNRHRPRRSWTIRNKMVKQQDEEKKMALVVWLGSSQIQAMKTMTNGATLMKKGTAEFHKLLSPRCKDQPALEDDAAKAAVAVLLALSLVLLLELVELVVVVPVVGRTVGVSTAVEGSVSVVVGVITELETERDVTGGVAPEMESEDTDDNEESVVPVEIRVMAKAGLVSAESPYTRIQTRILLDVFSSLG